VLIIEIGDVVVVQGIPAAAPPGIAWMRLRRVLNFVAANAGIEFVRYIALNVENCVGEF
jgi:hypothetical protein